MKKRSRKGQEGENEIRGRKGHDLDTKHTYVRTYMGTEIQEYDHGKGQAHVHTHTHTNAHARTLTRRLTRRLTLTLTFIYSGVCVNVCTVQNARG